MVPQYIRLSRPEEIDLWPEKILEVGFWRTFHKSRFEKRDDFSPGFVRLLNFVGRVKSIEII